MAHARTTLALHYVAASWGDRTFSKAAPVLWNTLPLQMISVPLSPHDALKHHFTSLKTDLIFLGLDV